jgi:hypothetical protein
VTVQVLSDLREPPVVGRFYLVPVVRDYPYCGFKGEWPVIGPKHTDVEFIQFQHEHYHIDGRFLTAAQERWVTNYYSAQSLEWILGGLPLCHLGSVLPKGRPVLVRRKCRRASYGYAHSDKEAIRALHAHYGEPDAIKLDDGRKLCPHRKADLTQFPPDAGGFVTCPLHGLRVQCGVPA